MSGFPNVAERADLGGRHMWTKIAAPVTAAFLGLASAASASAAEIVLVTTNAVEQILQDLIPAFERSSGHTIRMSVYGTGLAVAKVKDGSETPDLVLLSPAVLGDLAKAGKVMAG